MVLSQRLLAVSRVVVILVVLSVYMADTGQGSPIRALHAVSAAFLLASSAVIVGWIPAAGRWRALLLWFEIGAVTCLNWVASEHAPGGPMPALYAPIAVSLPHALHRRQWAAAAVAVAVGWALTSLLGARSVPGPWMYAEFGIYGSLLLFSGSVGLLTRNLVDEKERSDALLRQVDASRAALQRAHRQLQETAARQQELAVLEERQRLARDIHDSVAHCLTALVVQIQAARRLLERAPEQAAATVARCEEMAREALQETRRAVRALHPSGLERQAEADALRRLGRDFGLATGMSVEVTADSAALALPADPARLEQLYRIFQDALTNAHRHGQAKRVQASLSVSGGQLHLSIHNDGVPPQGLVPGMGLKSMVDRARSLGGAIRFEPGQEGLTVHVAIPLGREATS